jgi:hypothetical protein
MAAHSFSVIGRRGIDKGKGVAVLNKSSTTP